jgi:hypothetical protein
MFIYSIYYNHEMGVSRQTRFHPVEHREIYTDSEPPSQCYSQKWGDPKSQSQLVGYKKGPRELG